MAVVYQHRRNDNNVVFYVGIGKTERRAYSTSSRSKFWHNVVNKARGYVVEILFENINWDEACDKERYLIKEIGRLDLGLGSLVNMTDGGNGTVNISQAAREKLRAANLGKPGTMKGKKHTKEAKAKMKEKRKGKAPSKGTKRTEEQRKRIGASLKGRSGTMKGKKHTEEAKQKVKDAWTTERREKSRILNTSKKLSEETIKKRQESRLKNKLIKNEQDSVRNDRF
jgi:hypothetical protein